MDITNININRYYNKSIRYKLGIIDNIKDAHENMISNFIEHCYNNKNIFEKFKEVILNLNDKINRNENNK